MKMKITFTLDYDEKRANQLHAHLVHEPPLREMLKTPEGKFMAIAMDKAIAASQKVYEECLGKPTIVTDEIIEIGKPPRS